MSELLGLQLLRTAGGWRITAQPRRDLGYILGLSRFNTSPAPHFMDAPVLLIL